MGPYDKLIVSAQQTFFEQVGEQPLFVNSPIKRLGYTQAQIRRRFRDDPSEIIANSHSLPIKLAVVPGGRRIPLLKAMLTTACERDCLYCPFRAGRDSRRLSFQPDELATIFMKVYQAGKVDGLFLSAGLSGGGANTENMLLDTAQILRHKLDYRGYLHLKIMPGAEYGQIKHAMFLANRVSINLEAPNANRLRQLAPHKHFSQELLQPLRWITAIRNNYSSHRAWNGRWPSSTTQFVVGAAGESDLEILETSAHLFSELGLSRIYYMAFNPIAGTPFENLPAENPLRQHRLYQAGFLLRDYGFDLEELPFTAGGHLPRDCDPKLAYAKARLAHTPIELNLAEPEELLRVPGIGPLSVKNILAARRIHKLRDLQDLRSLHISPKRAAPYITLDGHRPTHQLALFD